MMRFAAIVAFFALVGLAGAQSIFPSLCSDLFPATSGTIFVAGGPQTGILTIAMLLVLLVLSALGIVYAFGYGLSIDSLKNFSRTEIVESIFSAIIIIFVAGGLGFAGSAISFVTNLASLGTSQLPGVATPPVINTAYDLYTNLCNNYVNSNAGLEGMIPAIVTTGVSQIFISTFQSLTIELEPSGFGFSVKPYAGVEPELELLNIEMDFFFLLVGFFIAIPVLLSLIYSLFPYFLYAGVLLRAFPWTRAAGGSMIAFFVGFYIIFPALIFPFSLFNPATFESLSGSAAGQIGNIMLFSLTAVVGASSFLTSISGASMVAEIQSFAGVAADLGVQALGLIIGLIISLDIVEELGDLLGAPSTSAKKLLSNVI